MTKTRESVITSDSFENIAETPQQMEVDATQVEFNDLAADSRYSFQVQQLD